MMRLVRLALVAAALGLAVAGALFSYDGHDLGLVVLDAVVGCVLVACGVAAWERRSTSRSGALMALAGFAWFVGTFFPAALFLHRGPLVHLHLSYPTGRLRRRLAMATVIVAYIDAALEPLARNDVVTLVVAALVAVTAADVFLRTSGPARKAGAPALVAALAFAAVLALGAVQRLAAWDVDRFVLVAYDTVIVAVAILLLIDLLSGRWTRATVADLVVDLGAQGGVGTLRQRLGRALGDRSSVLGYWISGEDRYVDETGHPVELPEPGGNRAATEIMNRDGEPLAVLIHDANALADQKLIAGVRSVARIAVSNARLQAEIRGRVADLAASRRRIVEAGDAQRRRLELELRRGAERRLERVAELLEQDASNGDGEWRPDLLRLAEELDGARAELRDFAQGIHPAVLSERGLPAALDVAAGRTPVRVTLDVVAGRLPPATEAAVYFVCCEGLANVAKHAPAAAVSVRVTTGDGQVVATIADDGAGGANPALGSGLRGLADRVEALGGRLVIDSPAGSGTTIIATLPADG